MKELIVSMTSWKKRIQFVKNTIENMLEQTIEPFLIELNLSEQEFPNREEDLPSDLMELIKGNPIIQINWCAGNTKVFKKLIPTIQKFYHYDCYIATVDDDVRYAKNYLETIVHFLIKNNTDKFCLATIPDNGSREIYRCTAFDEDLWTKLSDKVINYQIDDYYYHYYLECHSKRCKHLTALEAERIPSDMIIDLELGTHKLSDKYSTPGYIQEAITAIEKIKF